MLARALFIPLSFPLLALSCYCWAGNGLVDRTWTASGMDSYSYRQALRQPTVGSRYTLLILHPICQRQVARVLLVLKEFAILR